MSFFRLAIVSLRYHRRLNVALLLAVATTATVLTGALLVGDSMRGSLRRLVLERLGNVEEIVITDVFFQDSLIDQIREDAGFQKKDKLAESAILVRGSIKNQRDGQVAAGVTVIGCNRGFWKLGKGGPETSPTGDEIVLTSRLASSRYLDVQVGDRVVLQIGRFSVIPAESPLGRKTESVRRRQFRVSEIISENALGGFSLSPSQQLPRNAFIGIDAISEMLDVAGRCNLILVADESPGASGDRSDPEMVPTLEDYGLQLQSLPLGGGSTLSENLEYINLTSERMLLPEQVAQKAAQVWSDQKAVQPALTYLANWITSGEKKIPYSTVTAIDSVPALGPLLLADREPLLLADDEIVLNDWAAEDLGVVPGAEIQLTFFEPETTHGQVRERTETFKLRAIVPLLDQQGGQTVAGDRNLTPELKGVTDQESIDDWNPPFPFDASRVRDRDEQYWDTYRATPKAFISRSRGKQIWGSRFGEATSLRVLPAEEAPGTAGGSGPLGLEAKVLRDDLESKLADADLIQFRSIRKEALQAAEGTTPFGLLFLGFSMFLIAAALMLLVLLFRLGIDERSAEIGYLLVVGFSRARIFWLFFVQALVVVVAGGLIGVVGGVAYAALMVTGLRTLWVAAVRTPFLHLHINLESLLVGYLSVIVISALAIGWSIWQQRRHPARWWLDSGEEVLPCTSRSSWRLWSAGLGALIAMVLLFFAATGPIYLQAGLFFAAGGLDLFSCLMVLGEILRRRPARELGVGRLGLLQLALRNMTRHPQRSGITIGLMASATFLIMAVSAFRLVDLNSDGGELVAESTLPIHDDLATDRGRFELGMSDPNSRRLLEGATVASLRVHGGDDASCLNLYRARQPRLLGIPATMPTSFSAGSLDPSFWSDLEKNLGRDAEENRVVPVILDENTARYGLGLYAGIGERFEIENAVGENVTLEVVGLLKNSLFQGDLLIAETQLLRLFPDTEGYQYFLIKTAPENTRAVANLLEQRLSDFGFDAEPVAARLETLFAVQNTYLSSFQSLGGLGLILGTVGLVAVQLRNISGRRAELALMQACGFHRGRLAAMIVLENLVLLFAGLGIGFAAALLALVPQFAMGGATIPWAMLCAILGLVVLVGLLVGLYVVRAALRLPVIATLRGE